MQDKEIKTMKKRYEKVEFDYVEVNSEDVIRTSPNNEGGGQGDNGGFDTPLDPFF